MFTKCFNCLENNVFPQCDFLHSKHIYETKKKTTFSKSGLVLSVLCIIIFLLLFLYEITKSKKYPSVKYSKDFMKLRQFTGKTITLGFNVSEEWDKEIIFTLFDSIGRTINLTKCNENLEEAENGVYYCVINYTITINSNIFSTHILKLHLNKTSNINDTTYKIPFSICIREPIIDHSSYESPLNLYDDNSINKFKSSFYTNEITSFRRNLKLIIYETDGGFVHDNKNNTALYLKDCEDSRKGIRTNELNFIGSYRIVLSKEIDIYEKKFDGFMTIVSKVGGYSTPVFLIFAMLMFIFVRPLDNYRIYRTLKRQNHDLTEKIYNEYIKDNKEYSKDFEDYESFENVVNDNNICKKIKNHLLYLVCYCCYRNKNTKHMYIIDNYIGNELSLEKELKNKQEKDNDHKAQNDNENISDIEMNVFGKNYSYRDDIINNKIDNFYSQIN